MFVRLIVLLWILSPVVRAEPYAQNVCIKSIIQQYEQEVRNTGRTDKFMHCTLSCLITVECGATQSWAAGIAKELWDVIGPGDADWADLRADRSGIQLGRKIIMDPPPFSDSREECFSVCGKLWP